MSNRLINGQPIAPDAPPHRPSYDDLLRRLDDTESQRELIAERDTLAAEVKRLRAALQQAKMAARFPDASDAWDQVRDAVSALDEVPDAR